VGVPSARSVLAIALITALLLALAAVAAAPRRPSLLGEIEPTGPMAVAVWHPVTEVLADGSVLVVGPVQLGVEQLRAERWDPRTGRFTPVEGVPRTRARPGTFGSVRLPDGGALLIVKRIEGGRWTEASGGFAVRSGDWSLPPSRNLLVRRRSRVGLRIRVRGLACDGRTGRNRELDARRAGLR
jgi:hypothetical protein